MTIGTRIRQARHRAGMTQNQLARAIETSDRNVQRWEQDANTPRLPQLARIAGVTGVPVDELLAATDDEDERSPEPMVADLIHVVGQLVRLEIDRALAARA